VGASACIAGLQTAYLFRVGLGLSRFSVASQATGLIGGATGPVTGMRVALAIGPVNLNDAVTSAALDNIRLINVSFSLKEKPTSN
jgi:hypothetical protein